MNDKMQNDTVLIVDDTPENLAMLAQVLKPHYRVRATTSAIRALQIAMSEPRPDVILLDIVMPELDGYTVLERLKAEPVTQDIPILFVTGMDTIADEELGLQLGAVDYIIKPFQPGVVLARVRTHLELKHAKDRLKQQNALLETEVARRLNENLFIQDVSIRALARLAEVRDPETGNHLLRTQGYVRVLAQQLARHTRFQSILTPSYIETLVKSAPLHDIGKVGVPDKILLKPGRLSPEEWAIMRTHAKLGSDAIEGAERDAERLIPFLAIAKEIAHRHHERWDGSGYPDGLSGNAIPLSARLMALADVFDALISRRVYKPPLPMAHATDIIFAGRGKHFEPEIVDAFLEQQDSFLEIAEAHSDSEEEVLERHQRLLAQSARNV